MHDLPSIPGFEILEVLPRGGMSTVYKARQISLERIVALKTLPANLAQNNEDVEQFITEARLTANLKHANIVQVYDFGRTPDGLYYFVMEFVAGYSVAHWIRRKQRISEENTLLVAQSVADALKYAWEQEGIIHCDIKPDNIIIDSDGTTKVADLGLARSMRSITTESAPDAVFGTPNYLSPEQARGDPQLDFRTDIYALGATIYHCVTGKMPFEDIPPLEAMDRHISDTIPDPQELFPNLSTGCACLIEAMMRKNPADRPRDWGKVIQNILDVRSEKLPDEDFKRPCPSTVRRSAARQQHLEDIWRLMEQQETRRTDGLPERRFFLAEELPAKPQPKIAKTSPRIVRRRTAPAALAAGALLLMAIPLAGLLMHARTKPTPAPQSAASEKALPATANAQTAPHTETPKSDARERLAQELFENAVQWAAGHPAQYNQAIQRFEQVAADSRGTRYAALAAAEIQKLKQARNQAISAVMKELDEKAEILAKAARFQEAAAVYTNYTGDFANETATQRQAQAQACLARAKKHWEEQQARRKEIEQLWEKTVQAAANALLAGKPEDALAAVNAALANKQLEQKQGGLKEVAALCNAATQLDRRILESFRPEIGKTIEIRLKRGNEKLLIREVTENSMTADKIIPLETGYAVQPHTIKIEDLHTAEQRLRLGIGDKPEDFLLQGLISTRAQEWEAAERAFEEMRNALGTALVAVLKKQRRQQLLLYAYKDLERILARFGLSIQKTPAPMEIVRLLKEREYTALEREYFLQCADYLQTRYADLEEIMLIADTMRANAKQPSAAAPAPTNAVPATSTTRNTPQEITAALLACNPGLQASEISCQADEQGRITELTVISPALRSIQPLAEVTTLRTLICGGKSPEDRSETIVLAPLNSLEALRNLPLRVLSAAYTRIADLQPLSGNRTLTRLNLAYTDIADLTPLANIPLASLDIAGTRINNLTPLANMPLRQLIISRTRVSDLTPLRGQALEGLYAGGTAIEDIGALAGMPLRALDLHGTRVRDLAPLDKAALEWLSIADTDIKDISILHGMPIKKLDISGTAVKNIAPLRGMPLQLLRISRTNIKDITPIQYAPIEEIWLDFQPFRRPRETDRAFGEVLRQMPKLKTVNGMALPQRGQDWQ